MGKRKETSGVARVVERDVSPIGELQRLITKLGLKHSTWRVFEDFLALSAISISGTVDHVHAEERQAQYAAIAARYDADEFETLGDMLGCLILELERQDCYPEDALGALFHNLELHNKYTGQFFTPPNVCLMMAKMIIGGTDSAIDRIGYASVAEPCCGSGAMIIAMAAAMKDNGYNYQQQMVVHATDIDLKCVHMTYIQLALHNIPAVVIHGNTLTLQTYSVWYTPAYVWGDWERKKQMRAAIEAVIEIMTPINGEFTHDPTPPEPEPEITLPPQVAYSEEAFEQLTLF